MKSFQEVLVTSVLLLRICDYVAVHGKSITSHASPNNHILSEQRSDSLGRGTLLVSSDIPVTIQRYTGDATLPARGNCEDNPIAEGEGIVLVTSSCDTSNTTIIPEISLGEVVHDFGGSSVDSINITLDAIAPQGMTSMDFLEPTSYKMERSYSGCTEIYCGENPWDRPVKDGGDGVAGDFEENGAFSPQSFLFGVLALARVASSKVSTSSNQESRSLDSCTYNAEIFINGCQYDRKVDVTAPNVRVADATSKYTEVVTVIDEKMSEFNESVDFTFPADQITNLGAATDAAVQIEDVNFGNCGCCVCVGRPFIDASGSMLQAVPLFATADPTCSWSGDTSVVIDEGGSSRNEHTPIQNEFVLGKEWMLNALGEHASVASFSAFTIALMTNGAPSNLVEDALKAGLDEIRHAKISFEIASKLTGMEPGPGPLPKSTHAFQQNLTELAMAVAKEGCIDETLSALVAAAEVEAINAVLETRSGMAKYLNITDSTLVWIRDELSKIALDESNHSALAWRTLKWVCSVDAEACKAVNDEVLEERKVAMAFHRRFGSLAMDGGALANLMTAWGKIYAVQRSFELNAGNEIHEYACVKSDSGPSFLLASLVDNIVQNVLCNAD